MTHTPGPWRWVTCENGESSTELTLVGSPDDWQRCEYFCFGWPEGGSFRSRGPLHTPGHEHNVAPTVLAASGWHGSGDICIEPTGADALLIAAAPDLLESLRETRRALYAEYFAVFGERAAEHPAIKQADAAIAKAEGAR